MNFIILTIFPEIFPGILDLSITGNALKKNLWSIDVKDLKEHAIGKHRKIDDKPYGGSSGMIMRPDVISSAINDIQKKYISSKIIYPSPRGKLLNQQKIKELNKEKNLVILCGRFEGVDQRVIDYYNIEEISIGDFILSNGEIAAIAIIDSCVRLITGVISESSLIEETFGVDDYEGLLEYSQYTKPAIWNNKKVPEILMSGNHDNIRKWKINNAKSTTKDRRFDLWNKYLSK